MGPSAATPPVSARWASCYTASMAETRVAVAQLTSTPDVAHNLARFDALLLRAVRRDAQLVVFPECFSYLGPEGGQLEIAEDLASPGPILAHCAAAARAHGVELLLGGFWERANQARVYNTSVHLGADGEVKAAYRKIHLFDVDLADGTQLRESALVAPGESVVTSDACCGRLGLSICYDLRFPELYRKLVDAGAVVLAVPAAFTLHTGKDHWHVLLRARAIESQCYVLAAAQTGKHFGTRVSYGHAMVVDPWGTVLAECGEGEGVAVADVDTDVVARIRSQLPSLAHRRLKS
jgi:predicted amidohydrolase